jgi:hypothetical protein
MVWTFVWEALLSPEVQGEVWTGGKEGPGTGSGTKEQVTWAIHQLSET